MVYVAYILKTTSLNHFQYFIELCLDYNPTGIGWLLFGFVDK